MTSDRRPNHSDDMDARGAPRADGDSKPPVRDNRLPGARPQPSEDGKRAPAQASSPQKPPPGSKPAAPPAPGAASRPGGKPATPGKPGSAGKPAVQPAPTPGSSRPGGKPGTPAKPGAASPAPTARPGGAAGQRARTPARPGAAKPKNGASDNPAELLASRGRDAVRGLPSVQGMRVKERPTPQEPAWVQQIQQDLPPYADEVAAFTLVGIGLLSFFTLLSPASGALGSLWSGALRQAFGLGSFAVSAVILAAGGLMLLPKLGVEVRINWWRVILSEIAFALLLAYLHAVIRYSAGGEDGRIEAFAQAMEGRGGGMVGWAIQDAIHMLLGDIATGGVLLGLLAISLGLLIGVRRQHVLSALDGWQSRLLDFAARMDAENLRDAQIADARRRGRRMSAPLAGIIAARRASAAARIVTGQPPGGDGVRLIPLPGRPSIVTGEVGTGVIEVKPEEEEEIPLWLRERANGAPRKKPLKRPLQMRFRVNQLPDRKKLGKREEGLPPLELLDSADFERPDEEEINTNAQIIEEAVEDFAMQVRVTGVRAGPTVTQYAVQPHIEVEGKDGTMTVQRVRVTKIASLGRDLALALAAPRVRIQAPVPGTGYIGVEVPNARPGIVSLRPVIESEQYFKVRSPLAIALGREVDGKPFAVDLGAMPHLLIGGTTGSGKSVCISSIATCLVANNSPQQMRLIMIDPKMVELVRFNGLPHVLGRVEVELERIIGVLRWITREMDRRYKLMEQAQARNIATYNFGRKKKDRLPYIVVLVDELAELMTEYHDETEHLLTRLAQMARATGIHLIVATQRPSTDIVTGLIKANFPSRISFAVPSGIDSRVIIDSVGAEDLIGRGDMLYQGSDAAGPIRLQGCFVSDREMERVVEYWREHWTEEEDPLPPWEKALHRTAMLEETDDMLEEAIRFCQDVTEVSASLIQRRLNIGYPRAGRLIDALFQIGAVGPDPGAGRPRKVLIDKDVDPETYIFNWRMGR